MQTSFKIPVHKLSSAFIKDMKDKYGNAELEIIVNRQPDFQPLTEVEFWQLIELLDWSKETNIAIIEPLIEKLSSLHVAHIYNFQEILSQKLYHIDQKKYAENIGQYAYQEGEYFSVDHFLHVRACVVANGKEAYEEVVNDPLTMFKDLTFESLLSVASIAYERKTEKSFIYLPSLSYETYSNKTGWNIQESNK